MTRRQTCGAFAAVTLIGLVIGALGALAARAAIRLVDGMDRERGS